MLRQVLKGRPCDSSAYNQAYIEFVNAIGSLSGQDKLSYETILDEFNALEESAAINWGNLDFFISVLKRITWRIKSGFVSPGEEDEERPSRESYVCMAHDLVIFCPEASELSHLLVPFDEQFKHFFHWTQKFIEEQNNKEAEAILLGDESSFTPSIAGLRWQIEGLSPAKIKKYLFCLNETLCCLVMRQDDAKDVKHEDQYIEAQFFREFMRYFPQAEQLCLQMLADYNQFSSLERKFKDLFEDSQYLPHKETVEKLLNAIKLDRVENPKERGLLAETLWLVHDQIIDPMPEDQNDRVYRAERLQKVVSKLEDRFKDIRPLVAIFLLEAAFLAAVCVFGFGFVATVPAWSLYKLVPTVIGTGLKMAWTATFFYDSSNVAGTARALKATGLTKSAAVPVSPTSPAS